MGAQTGRGSRLALASTTLTSLGYLREHGAAAALPCLSLRRPAQSASGAALVVVGLVAPATSLAGGTREGGGGSTTAALIWLGATGPVRSWSSRPGTAPSVQRRLPVSPAKLATRASLGPRLSWHSSSPMSLGTAVLQVGYQSGGALTVAGLATLLANASPVAAATALGELSVGPLGGLRAFGFVAVSACAFLLAQPTTPLRVGPFELSARSA